MHPLLPRGESDCQLILRGGADEPNYTSSNVEMARIALDTVKAPMSIMIDCSHANSSKGSIQAAGCAK